MSKVGEREQIVRREENWRMGCQEGKKRSERGSWIMTTEKDQENLATCGALVILM